MCKNEITLNEVKRWCRAYGLTYADTSSGFLVFNGKEYWVIKLTKNGSSVRKLFHQNHYKNGQSCSYRIKPEMIDNDFIKKYFHDQGWQNKDFSDTLKYIRNHGLNRSQMDKNRRSIMERIERLSLAAAGV